VTGREETGSGSCRQVTCGSIVWRSLRCNQTQQKCTILFSSKGFDSSGADSYFRWTSEKWTGESKASSKLKSYNRLRSCQVNFTVIIIDECKGKVKLEHFYGVLSSYPPSLMCPCWKPHVVVCASSFILHTWPSHGRILQPRSLLKWSPSYILNAPHFTNPGGMEARVELVRSGDWTQTSCTHERTCVGAVTP